MGGGGGSMTRGGGGELRALFSREGCAGRDEAQLLEAFAVHRDGAAFEALVARHGATVLGVCRRWLRDPNDVDDAFQATFLVLARKAGGLRDKAALGPWLHGVACRVAARARSDGDRRRRREMPDERAVARAAAPAPGRPDLRRALDEEILRLPDRLRLPVILCLIEGRTYAEAAEQLRWPAATVRGRLAAARARLRDRLVRRGEASASALTALAAGPAAVPPGLVARAAQLATRVAARGAVASSAAALAGHLLRGEMMIRTAIMAAKWTVGGLVALAGAAGLGWLDGPPGGPAAPVAPPGPPAPARGQASPPSAPQPGRPGGQLAPGIHPITVEGRALDPDGRPVAGAAIVVTNANRSRPGEVVLGRATSGADGRFVLVDLPLPVLPPAPGAIPRPAEGRFEVAGSAPGRAFAWHATQSYRPTAPPAGPRPGAPGLAFSAGEPIVADLVFGPPARVRGRVVDDAGRPVAGAKVQFGFVDDTRIPDGSGMWYCAAIDPAGGDEPTFNGIGSLPEAVRATRTDADGRYEIDSLPREAKLTVLIAQDPSLDPYAPTVATSGAAFPGVVSLGHDGTLDHTFIRPRPVPVRVTLGDSGRPGVGVTVLAQGERPRRAGAIATTDAAGRAVLELPPGSYRLRAEPPPGLPCCVGAGDLEVRAEPPGPPVALVLGPGAEATLEAVDAESGRGIAGVGFDFVADTTADRLPVNSQPAYVDHPTTDEAGQLRVVMTPGRGRFLPARPPRGYEPSDQPGAVVTLEPGRPAVARFALRKRAERPKPAEDETGRRLRLLWEGQARLLARGRIRATKTFQMGTSIHPDRLRLLLAGLDPDRVPDLVALIGQAFPGIPAPSSGRYLVVGDGPKARQETTWAPAEKPIAPDVIVDNGFETIRYSPGSAQADIGDGGRKSGLHLGVDRLADFAHWPAWGGTVVGRAGGRVTLERGSGDFRNRIVADEATGFVYQESSRYDGGTSGRECWQFAPRVVGGGAIVPGLSVSFDVQGDQANSLWIRSIESVDLATAVPPAAFLMAVPPGTVVLDYREGRDDTYRGATRRPVTDVVAHADADPRRFRPFVPPVRPGQPAPAIDPLAWLDATGPIPAPDLAGRVVLVDFWGIDCGPCISQLPEVRAAAAHFAARGLVIIGLHDSSATPERVAEFARKRGLTWPLAVDRPGEGFGATFAAYGVRSIPRAAVLDRQGRLAFLGQFDEALVKAADLLKPDGK